jgi:hypothetical protein
MNKFAIVTLFGGLFLAASPAYAYIDPGTGGVLVQLLTGGVAGLVVLLKLYGEKIRATFRLSARNNRVTADDRSSGGGRT